MSMEHSYPHQDEFINKENDVTERQLRITGKLKNSTRSEGVEVFTFTIRLGFFEIVCICNIPQELYAKEDRKPSKYPLNEAPVYVKFKLCRPRPEGESYSDHKARDPEPVERGGRAENQA